MAQIDIRREYNDGDILLESDLDAVVDDVETFLNTTKINDDNIQTSGITGSSKLADATVTAAKLATDSVTTAKIEALAVTAAKLAADSVTTAKILDANVTAAKLATDSVTTAKITDANVTAAKLASDSVTTAKILDSNVTDAKIAGMAYSKLATATALQFTDDGTWDPSGTGTSTRNPVAGVVVATNITNIASNDILLVVGATAGHSASSSNTTWYLRLVLLDSGGSAISDPSGDLIGNGSTTATYKDLYSGNSTAGLPNLVWNVGTLTGTPAYLGYQLRRTGGSQSFTNVSASAIVVHLPQ